MTTSADDSPSTFWDRYIVLSFLCLMAVIAYVQRAALSVPAKEIAADLKFANQALDMQWVFFCWYFTYAIFQIPSGRFADRLGSRWALAVLCSIWSLVTAAAGFATSFTSLIIVWGLMGLAQAGAFPCAAKAIGQIFPDTERARASGILASGMMIGSAIGPYLTGQLLQYFQGASIAQQWKPWRIVFSVYAIPGILWVVAFLMSVRSHQLPRANLSQQAKLAKPIDWSRVFQSGSLALLCGQQFFRAAAMVFFATWFPSFLQETRGVSRLDSGLLTTIVGVGGVLGSLSGGFSSDWLLKKTGNSRLSRQGVAVVGLGTCSMLILASYFVADVRAAIGLIALGAFCATFGGVSGYTVAIKFGGEQVATVFSIMNMCGNFGSALFPLAAGEMVKRTGNWNLMLFLFAGIMAVDAVCWAFLNPQGTLFGDEREDR
ncbi:MAG: MFS transporter [Planctomycetota bacterium]|nr:MAG: MFS transporter [Planctomycetota bacterium]